MNGTPEEIAAQIGENVDRNNRVSVKDLELVERALKAYPESVEFWCLRGDLIQVSDGDGRYLLEDAEASYLKASEIDPEDAEAFESLGFYYDAICADPEKAEPLFRRAIELGAGESAHEGLAEVIAALKSRTG